jgi:acetate kinase
MYPIDPEIAGRKGIRKYGFHGLSYAFITKAVAGFLHKVLALKDPLMGSRFPRPRLLRYIWGRGHPLVPSKMANPSILRTFSRLKSVNWRMGLTPLEGLPGATRSGSLDPSLIFHYTSSAAKLSSSSTEKMHITEAEDIFNKKSGWKALTGTTDFGVITKKAAGGDEMAQLAVDLFVDRVVGYVGSYWVKLGGKVDALVFAAGIGEKGKDFRAAVSRQVGCLGIRLDVERNDGVGDSDADVIEISSGGGVKTLVVKTDEQVHSLDARALRLIVGRDGSRIFGDGRHLEELKARKQYLIMKEPAFILTNVTYDSDICRGYGSGDI